MQPAFFYSWTVGYSILELAQQPAGRSEREIKSRSKNATASKLSNPSLGLLLIVQRFFRIALIRQCALSRPRLNGRSAGGII